MTTKKKLNDSAAQATAKLFSGVSQSSNTSENREKSLKNTTSQNKKVFSFRGNEEDVKAWRLYASISGTKVDDLGSMALNEYLKNHPLVDIEKALFDKKMNS